MSPEEKIERDRLAKAHVMDAETPMSKRASSFKEGWNACAAYRDSKLADIGEFDEDAARAEYDRLDDETDQYAEDFLDAYTWMKAAAWQHSQDKAALAEKDAENERLATRLIEFGVEHPCYQLSKKLEQELKEAQEKIVELQVERDAYATAMAIALGEGVFANKRSVKERLESALKGSIK